MKIKFTIEEWCPVYMTYQDGGGVFEIEISEEELLSYKKSVDDFRYWQNKINKRIE